jgi:hypothetical protein
MPFIRQRIGALARLNHHVPIWLLAALVFAAVWLHTFRLIGEDRTRAMTGAESDIVNLARVSQEHADFLQCRPDIASGARGVSGA